MPRNSKIEVSAVNIRIPSDKNRNYSKLLVKIHSLKMPIKVYGDSFVAMTSFDPVTGYGIFSKFTEIDVDGDWFDIDDFAPAAPEKIEGLVVPEALRPNLSAFYFQLIEAMHIIVFESYSDSKALSSRSVEKYFRGVLDTEKVVDEFGFVEADIVKSYGEVERILALEALRELSIVIRRPNPDDVSGDLAAEIEERLREQNGEEYQETIKSKDPDGLKPSERTRKLAMIGAENGEVSAKSLVSGIVVPHTTAEKPEKLFDTYSREDVSTLDVFKDLAKRMSRNIRSRRADI
ncbi:MAG: DUF4747 family protein [Acetobacteraceae bacterium]|jgi:hypothetical protein|nr:DUF4747 family protein [Acetobacteraceae bacterium]